MSNTRCVQWTHKTGVSRRGWGSRLVCGHPTAEQHVDDGHQGRRSVCPVRLLGSTSGPSLVLVPILWILPWALWVFRRTIKIEMGECINGSGEWERVGGEGSEEGSERKPTRPAQVPMKGPEPDWLCVEFLPSFTSYAAEGKQSHFHAFYDYFKYTKLAPNPDV